MDILAATPTLVNNDDCAPEGVGDTCGVYSSRNDKNNENVRVGLVPAINLCALVGVQTISLDEISGVFILY